MKNTILDLEGVQVLSRNEQKNEMGAMMAVDLEAVGSGVSEFSYTISRTQ
ncbi:hypothetical protein [Flavobacterium cyanobacteriorum]|nr:hypothetical protein [Flavobacterium cyanobacteriorum]